MGLCAGQENRGRAVSEIKRDPIYSHNANGDELATFDADHSLADIARWVCQNTADGEELARIVAEILTKTDGMVMQ